MTYRPLITRANKRADGKHFSESAKAKSARWLALAELQFSQPEHTFTRTLLSPQINCSWLTRELIGQLYSAECAGAIMFCEVFNPSHSLESTSARVRRIRDAASTWCLFNAQFVLTDGGVQL